MPSYRYKAFDSSGKDFEGSIQATSASEAMAMLKGQGLKIRTLSEEGGQAPAGQPPRPTRHPSTGGEFKNPGGNPKPAKPPSPSQPNQQLRRPSQPSVKPSQPAPKQPQAYAKPQPPNQPSAARPRSGPQDQIDLSQAPSAPPGMQLSGPAFQNYQPQGAPVVINVPAAPVKTNVFTAPGTDKERMFLFAQLAAAFRAGINPANAFQEVATRTPAKYRDSLMEMATQATEGLPASAVMERYPDLYPEHIPYTIKAGEVGGFIPDAYDAVSQQAENAHKFRRWFWFVYIVLINALLSLPLAWFAKVAMVESYKSVEKSGAPGPSEAIGVVAKTFFGLILWPYGPLTIGLLGAFWVLYKFLISRVTKSFRHYLAYKWPVVGQRARFEGLTSFSWVMGRLGQSGIPYSTSWELAAGAVPNLTMRNELLQSQQKLTGSERASDLISNTRIFPPEYASVVATGEYAGNVPGSLEQLSRMSRQDFETQTNLSKARTGCWGALGCFVTTAICLMIVLIGWYYDLPKVILSGMEP